jgi:hypothetical protein
MAKKRKAKKDQDQRQGNSKENKPKKEWFTPNVKRWSAKVGNDIELE